MYPLKQAWMFVETETLPKKFQGGMMPEQLA
jgi:hypothetical protein